MTKGKGEKKFCRCGQELPAPDADGTEYAFCSAKCKQEADEAAKGDGSTSAPAGKRTRAKKKPSKMVLVTLDGEKPDILSVVTYGNTLKALRAEAKAAGKFAVLTIRDMWENGVEIKEVITRKSLK